MARLTRMPYPFQCYAPRGEHAAEHVPADSSYPDPKRRLGD